MEEEEEKRVAWECDGLLWTQHDKWFNEVLCARGDEDVPHRVATHR